MKKVVVFFVCLFDFGFLFCPGMGGLGYLSPCKALWLQNRYGRNEDRLSGRGTVREEPLIPLTQGEKEMWLW